MSYCIAIGVGARANGTFAAALGDGVENDTDYSVVFGPQLSVHEMGLSENEVKEVVNIIMNLDYDAWQARLSSEDYTKFVVWLTKFRGC
jgi:hypothetical protein